ncbi:alkaline phosphatase-like [Myzus persicae]|uniref:alkaline phosphatase-like n=1 Tax=Myzus persicae TaxID=13164 RepID=UPI000B937FE2|nr:alkaline phosphatase-like [Myzus persicae]XP_022162134.1 alkaline phosphatase-like [Myzus persicae]
MKILLKFGILLISVVPCILMLIQNPTKIQDRDHWYEEARSALKKRLASFEGKMGRAKNVVFLVGDGMGASTLTASRIFKGQRRGNQGEEEQLIWDTFPAVAMAKTYNLNAQIGESSACATALLCGVKANFETVGLDGNGKFENCYSSFGSRVDSLAYWAQQQGKSTGLVTNTRITHATPSALYAHSPSRYWEDDGKVPIPSRKSCKDIARQLVEDDPGRFINVILGGGRRHWLPKVAQDPEQPTDEGRRLDGRNLIDDWIRDKKKRNIKAEYVWNNSQLDKIDAKNVDYLLGLFAYSHMEFEVDRDKGQNGDPPLHEMAVKALSILQKNNKGFFLFVESGRIDHAHHYNNPYRALEETLVLESTLEAILSKVDLSETLIVVTADHSHVMTMGGLATPRGNDILGVDVKPSDVDGLPYSTLLYGNGPGHRAEHRLVPMVNATDAETHNRLHGAAVPRQWATHGGEDVPVYAAGPQGITQALFSGTFDQSYVPHAIAYVACLAEHAERCRRQDAEAVNRSNSDAAFAAGKAGVLGVGPSSQGCSVDTNAVTRTAATGGAKSGAAIVLASSVLSDNGSSKQTNNTNPLLNLGYALIAAAAMLVVAVT